MTRRSEAIAWLRDKGWNSDERVCVSKLYSADESWTGSPVWWFEFPAAEILTANSAHSHINLICESGSKESKFHHFRIPISFIREKHNCLGFREKEEKYSLYLSAEPDTLFRELRGKGKVEFADFEVLAK